MVQTYQAICQEHNIYVNKPDLVEAKRNSYIVGTNNERRERNAIEL